MTSSVITPAAERIRILDILRGFAVFGILAVNITTFVLPNHDFAQMDFGSQAWYDRWAMAFNEYFTEGKFYILFSFLFGIGFSVQLSAAERKGADIFSFYPRRLLILFAIGVLHSFLWWGDVLRLYAVLGLALLLLHKMSVRALLVLSALSLMLSVLVAALPQWFGGENMPNADSVFYSLPFSIIHMGPTAFALFLLGRVAGKTGFFANLPAHTDTLKKMMAGGLVVWLLLKAAAYLGVNTDSWQGTLPRTLGDMALTSVYIAVLCLLFQQGRYQKWLAPIGAVGQTALTNYVMQTLVCVVLFQGLNWQGKVGSAQLLLMTLVIYGGQMLFSTWWLKHFQYGLLEWLWRSFTFGRIQPLKKIV